MLTDLPIGAWVMSALLDAAGGPAAEGGADLLVAVGVVAAVPATAAGLNDWSDTAGPEKFGSASSLSNSHWFASRCARQHLQRTGSLADACGAFETVAVHVVGEVADEAGVLHAEGGGGELGIQVGDELGDPGLPA